MHLVLKPTHTLHVPLVSSKDVEEDSILSSPYHNPIQEQQGSQEYQGPQPKTLHHGKNI